MQQVEIRVKGHINSQWSNWFGGLTINHPDPDEAVLTGLVPDQAALYGIISRLRDLGLQLSSVTSEEVKEDPENRDTDGGDVQAANS
jgi:hypothetical protein